MRHWVNSALSAIEADYQRSADTHLIKLELPNFEGINVYLKDESTHPTGSLKHRLARSLFLYALCNGKIDAKEGPTGVGTAGSCARPEWGRWQNWEYDPLMIRDEQVRLGHNSR